MTKWVTLVVAVLVSMFVGTAHADFFSSSPGALSKSHATLDNQSKCNDCHVNGTSEVSNELCLGCHDHKDLAARINAGKGFHASGLVKGKECEDCHNEHKGRDFDLMGWNKIRGGQKGFDHDLTGWPLKGKHASTDCAECHKAKNKTQGLTLYMGTDTLCGASGCHAQDQPHKFDRKDMLLCDRCHNESVWKPQKNPMRFDHDDRRDAGMPILGSHKDVACTKCHPKSVFNLPFADPDACGNSGCHASPHTNHLFDQRPCEWCHSPTFKTLKQRFNRDMPFFDHEERTTFELGAHKKLPCYDCHTKALGENKPVGSCEKCHAKDNRHQDRFNKFGDPPKCGTCHPTTAWTRKVFNHGRYTKFDLTAKHADISCRACHRGKSPSDFENFGGETGCMNCHQHRKVHADPQNPNGKFKNSQCLNCHLKPGSIDVKYQDMVKIYHGPDSNFPLVKSHKGVACEDCHKGRDKKGRTTFETISRECGTSGCHEDILHKGTLGDTCTPCHSSGTWDALNFDHNVDTFPDGTPGYPLKGEHKNNTCESCHGVNRQFKDTPRACSADGCHAEDDAHKGRLGKECEKCHVETGDNLFNHNTMSVFHLDGKHLDVRCADCHPSVTFKPRPLTCFGCHPEPAVHKGQYGTGCEQCHTTRTWEDIKPLHDVGDFSLTGMHDNIACERCHRDNRPLAGSGNLCINCHRQDDIHSNSLSPRCGECHTQWSFAPARFDHANVGCNLTGLHRTVACFDCHKNGNFSGITAECAGCHIDDALKTGTHTTLDRRTRCTGGACHNPNFWSPQGNFQARESVCR